MMRIVFWGTYDLGKPRVRIMLRGLRENGLEVIECHRDIWKGTEDKSQLYWQKKTRIAVRWLLAYPFLILCYLKQPKHDVVIVGYLGHLDVLVLWFFAKLRGTPVVWDAFLSLYDTAVCDRKLFRPNSVPARLLYGLEWLACRAARLVLLDTATHATYFGERYKIPPEKLTHVFAGVEPEFFPYREPQTQSGSITVLFYGQFIPLHGIETIVEAARELEDRPIKWIIVGHGQEAPKISKMLALKPLPSLLWVPWVPYHELSTWIAQADICLGIFGKSDKASRVIPNKVFQVLASGKPLITGDTPAIRELLSPEMEGVYLTPVGDAHALADTVANWNMVKRLNKRFHVSLLKQILPDAIGANLLEHINKIVHVKYV